MTTQEKHTPHIFGKLVLILLILIVVVVVVKYLHSSGDSAADKIIGEEGEVTTITESTLEEVFEISELSTVDYAYNAIACAYDEDETEIVYYVAYEGTVTAGIDFSGIDISIDEEAREITLIIPECTIQDTIVDFGSMEYIFVDEKYDTETVSSEAYKLCKADLAARAAEEEDLLELAGENAQAAVEALVNPWVEQLDDSYTVIID